MWFREVNTEGLQFLVERDDYNLIVTVSCRDENHGLFEQDIICDDKNDLDECFYDIQEEELLNMFYDAKAKLN